MELVKIGIENFRGINKKKYIKTDLLNVIVGRNDAGKSTILKALDLFLNDAKCERVGEIMLEIEKQVMLQVLDNPWKDHLATMDHLRQGINLRSYAQKNPKQEYKREAFELFQSLLMKQEIIRSLLLLMPI